ncbi:MAG TPA: hypothetical protein VGE72_28875 [Azospirillum sp.]
MLVIDNLEIEMLAQELAERWGVTVEEAILRALVNAWEQEFGRKYAPPEIDESSPPPAPPGEGEITDRSGSSAPP